MYCIDRLVYPLHLVEGLKKLGTVILSFLFISEGFVCFVEVNTHNNPYDSSPSVSDS